MDLNLLDANAVTDYNHLVVQNAIKMGAVVSGDTFGQLILFFGIAVFIAAFLLMIFFWKKNFLLAAIYCRIKSYRLSEVKIWYRDGTHETKWIPNIREFDFGKSWFKKMFDALPNDFDRASLPVRPYSVDRKMLTTYYEFHEGSNAAVDPRGRAPDILLYEVNQSNLLNFFQLGVKWATLKNKPIYDAIIMLLLLAGIAVGVMSLSAISDQGTIIKHSDAIVTSIPKLISDINASGYGPGMSNANIAGVVR